ncbi:PEP-CTERM sorting domain-containing protein [Amantichitinum ursilacus]|uniref:PEP-CTERM motif protein n=1 Tax=Amantichitinum ursilacus TaxID=857265 RepID=A0A0N1JTU9_9NEIS|nr:PEP-CTERM sorting domain-containing protein [Amantichitinum ursilacus]KPC54597.1 PEP-CTERM motif protein [Amantichitinum ursilacus]
MSRCTHWLVRLLWLSLLMVSTRAMAGQVPRQISFTFFEHFINCCHVPAPNPSWQETFVSSDPAVDIPAVTTFDGVARFSFDVQQNDIVIRFLGDAHDWPVADQQYPFIVLWGLGYYNDISVTTNLVDAGKDWILFNRDPGYMGIGWGGTTQAGDYIDIRLLPVPEPETWALLGVGVVGLLAARGRRNRAMRRQAQAEWTSAAIS